MAPAAGAPVEEWDRMVAVNLLGVLYTTHAALPALMAAAADSPRRIARTYRNPAARSSQTNQEASPPHPLQAR